MKAGYDGQRIPEEMHTGGGYGGEQAVKEPQAVKSDEMRAKQDKPYQYWLMNIKGAAKKKKVYLLQKLGTAQEVHGASEKELRALAGDKAAEKIMESKKIWNILEEYEKLCRQKIKFTCYGDPDYPVRLSEVSDAPFSLYYQGRLPSDRVPSVALIGARACSEYGVFAAKEFGSKLAEMGIQIISGLAMGIDGISQEAALLAGGESFGVLGCGVDICYPKSNRRLYERCRQQGGILSEYPPGTKPQSCLFPPRNRIISGLSDIVVVVEAREKSGTLITVDMALEQGREVYAVPGRITDSLSRGCNQLFHQGAGVAVSPGDIVQALCGIRSHAHRPFNIEETVYKNMDGIQQRTGCIPGNMLSAQEREVYGRLEALPKTAEEIFRQMNGTMAIQDIMSILVELCLKGLAMQGTEGYCQKVLAT